MPPIPEHEEVIRRRHELVPRAVVFCVRSGLHVREPESIELVGIRVERIIAMNSKGIA